MNAPQGPFWLDSHTPAHVFPDVELALAEPDGLLAVGGDLSPDRLLSAYSQGIFPWFSGNQPILWWSPNPRAVLFPEDLKISRSLRKRIRKQEYSLSLDEAFEEVVRQCAAPRKDQDGTWITDEMRHAYGRLHEQGYAHSVEVWHQGDLVGGLYGIALGKVFFGESMFSRRSDASKLAFAYLVRQLQLWGYPLIDCQVSSAHLHSLGAVNIDRSEFRRQLSSLVMRIAQPNPWRFSSPSQLFPDIFSS